MHEGHAGWTIDPGYNMISSSYSGISKLVPSPALDGNPSIILLMIGTNDLFARDTAGMATRLEALLDKVAAERAERAHRARADHTARSTDDRNLTAYNAKIPGIIQAHAAKGQHIIGVDMSKLPIQRAHRRHAPERSRVRVHGEHLVRGNQRPVAEVTGLGRRPSSTEIL